MNDFSDNVCIIILGMHRSGTSALSGILKITGLNPGKELFAPEEDNPKGNYENARITLLNESILDELYAKWNDTLLIPADWWLLEKFDKYSHQIRAVILDEFQENKAIVIKDPRLSVLLPIYQKVFLEIGVTPKFIICCRNPLEIAASLFIRNNLSLEKAVLLWLDYQLKAELYTRGLARIFVNYRDLLNKQFETLKVISTFIGINLQVDNNERTQISSFLDPGLKHHNLPDTIPELDQFPEISTLYEMFSKAGENNFSDDQLSNIDYIREKFYRSFKFYNGLTSSFEASLLVVDEMGKKTSSKMQIKYGHNVLKFDLRTLGNIRKVVFKPSNSRVGIALRKIEVLDKHEFSREIEDYKTNAAPETNQSSLIFETEMPEITIEFQKSEQLNQIIYNLDYLVFGRATYRLGINMRGDAYKNLSNKKNQLVQQHNQRISQMIKEVRNLELQSKKLMEQNELLRHSFTWRLGKFIMSPLQYIYKLMK